MTAILRKFIKESLNDSMTAAGIVLLRKFLDGWKVLLLKQPMSEYDLPKGKIKSGESPHDAATRETFEETGIDDIEFVFGDIHKLAGSCLLYFGITDSDVIIHPNAETNELEHHNAEWLSINDAINVVPVKFVNALDVADKLLKHKYK